MTMAILGAGGQLGRALAAHYPDAALYGRTDVDIADRASVDTLDWQRLDTVLNAAAYTNVDEAQTMTGRRLAWQANTLGALNLARAAAGNDVTLVHFSTDYVFDGTIRCHAETETFSPLNVYGQTKAAGDTVVSLTPSHYIVRVSWLTGDGPSFVDSMRQLALSGAPASVVADQVGRPTFCAQVVDIVDHLLSSRPDAGTYNGSNDGEPVSWAELARAVFERHGRSPDDVRDVDTADYYRDRPDAAPRPLQSTLDLDKIKLSGMALTDWRDGLEEFLRDESR